MQSDEIHKKNYEKMVAKKERKKQIIRETAEKEIQQLNDQLKKTTQEIQSLRQKKVNRNHVYS